MSGFNRGQIPQGLIQFFGVKGTYSPSLEETILPTVQLANLIDSPYLRFSIPVGRTTSVAAVAAENGFVLFRPGVGQVLQIKQVTMLNATAAAKSVVFSILSQADITTAGLAEIAKLLDLAGANAKQARPSSVWAGTHTAQVGSGVQRFRLPANSTTIWTLPDPGIILFSNDETGIPAAGVVNETLNEALDDVGVFGREWPLPG